MLRKVGVVNGECEERLEEERNDVEDRKPRGRLHLEAGSQKVES